MALTGYDDWLQAQNCLLGAALLSPDLVPRIVTELHREDFSGYGLSIYDAMSALFRESKTGLDVDCVAVSQKLGGTNDARRLIAEFMGLSPSMSDIDRYIQTVKEASRLSRLRDIGASLSSAVDLSDAMEQADRLTDELMHRSEYRSFGPEELIASYEQRHHQESTRLKWPIPEMTLAIPTRKGNMIAIMAEPSGGKTAFGLQCMWDWSVDNNVLFVSLETDQDTLFDTWSAFIAGIEMDAVMGGPYSGENWYKWKLAKEEIRKRRFKILPGASMNVAQIKAAAIKYKADIVIVDYLQLIQMPGKKNRFEAVTEISMQLHTVAQNTGFIVVPLCQVSLRDPSQRNSPMTMHSARESGQIEQDCDVMIAIDLFIEKSIKEEGIQANRVIRCVKNKRGRKFRIPAVFDGRLQSFRKSKIPNKDWENAQNSKRQTDPDPEPEDGFCQLEMLPEDTPVPFEK